MPLVTMTKSDKRHQHRLSLHDSVMNNIQAYCAWAKIQRTEDFIEQAAHYIFAKDVEWKNHKKACDNNE